jgi:hypothetical protein
LERFFRRENPSFHRVFLVHFFFMAGIAAWRFLSAANDFLAHVGKQRAGASVEAVTPQDVKAYEAAWPFHLFEHCFI